MRVFVAGATGAIGKPLVQQLIAGGHQVTGMTRSPKKAAWLRDAGAVAVVCDAFDARGVNEAVHAAQPDVVIDELTDLPHKVNPFRFSRFYAGQNPLKRSASKTLLQAAIDAGARRHIMQSVAFAYDPAVGEGLHVEDDPLWREAPKPWDETLPLFIDAERLILEAAGIDGIVLRYGFFYGPGTHFATDGSQAADVRRRRYPIVGDGGGVYSFIHITDAAHATVLAAEVGAAGAYNVVDDSPLPVREWLPDYAAALGAKPPRRVPTWLARLTTSAIPTHFSTTLRGASNARIRRQCGWRPAYPDPRDGFRHDLSADKSPSDFRGRSRRRAPQ
jgi:nucleoside-diphosphate-sugar epimerase